MSESVLHPAATLILMRDRDAAAPELLMIQRSAQMGFGAEAWVFPGGRVDPGDRALAETLISEGASLDDITARVAAIRETIEEAGVAVGLDPMPDGPALAAIRAGLHAGEPFADLLASHGLGLVPDALLPLTRWQPPIGAPKRFDTHFFLARAPDGAVIEADGGETVAICWTDAEAMLARKDARIMFPTACNLRRLGAWQSFAEAAADARSFPPATIVSMVVEIDGERYVQIPAGHGYPETRVHSKDLFRG